MPKRLTNTAVVVAWTALAPMIALSLTQWIGYDGSRLVVVLQALSLYLLAPAALIALAATTTGRSAMAVAALVPLTTLVVLTAPVVWHGDPPAAAAGSPTFTIGYANLLASNPTPGEAMAAVAAMDADVIVLVELTPRLRAALDAAVPDDAYPYRAESVEDFPSGIGLWSRLPMVSGGVVSIGGRVSVDVVLDVDGQPARVVAVHPYPPTFNATGWSATLDAIGDRVAGSPLPTVVVGDFNGARWHPSFRDLLDRGFTDTHEVLGHGFSVSWPMDEGVLPPQFVRIDHSLYGEGIAPLAVDDVGIPGSDHKGFVAAYAFTALR